MAGPLEDLMKTLDLQPADIATLFAGLRTSVPVYAAMGATGLNEGEDERLRQIYGPLPSAPVPRETPEAQQRRMVEDFEQRFPTPELRAAVLEQMRANRREGRYDPSDATRRIDLAPHNQPGYRGAVAAPSIGKRKFQSGGGVKKTVQQMADEMMLKGKPAKETVDLSRRGFFRLPESKSMPLAKIDDKALNELEQKYGKQGQAPTITEKKVEVSPDAGKTKSTLKSVTETPVSRREVLKSAAGQALQGVLPNTGIVGDIAKVVNPVESIVQQTVAPSLTHPYAVVMSMLKQGKSEQDIIDALAKQGSGIDEYTVDRIISNIKSPGSYLSGDLPTLKTPSGALREMADISPDVWEEHYSPLKMRPELRQLRSADPDAYKEMLDAAKTISMMSIEEAANMGLKQEWIDKYMKGAVNYNKLPEEYTRKIDNINSGFGDDY